MLSPAKRRLLTTAVALALGVVPLAVFAQTVYSFSLPKQPLAQSLRAVGTEAKVDVAFKSKDVRGLTASSLNGRYSAQQALEDLLAGTGLTLHKLASGAYVIQVANEDPPADPPRQSVQKPHDGSNKAGQPITGSPQNAETLKGVTVVGFAASLQKSLQTERNADSIVSAVTAESLGKFPNTNVAEALTMTPGVTVDRQFGQGSQITVNGTPTALNLTYLDGHPVAQTDWLLNVQPNRGFDYTLLAPQVVGRIEIFKTAQAKLPSGSIGGTIFVHTRKPLDEAANTFSASVGEVYNDQQAGAPEPNASAFYSWKNTSNTVGVDVAVSHYEEQIARWGSTIHSYVPVSALVGNSAVAEEIASGTIRASDLMPTNNNAPWFQQARKRNTALVNFQVRPNFHWELDLSGLYINADRSNYNSSLFPLNAAAIPNITSLVSKLPGLITSGHVCGEGDTNPEGLSCAQTNTEFQALIRTSQVVTKNVNLKLKYSGANWGSRLQAGVGLSHNNQSTHNLTAFYKGGYAFNLTTGTVFDNPTAALDPANWAQESGAFGQSTILPIKAHETWGSLHFHVNFDNSAIYQLLFGVRYLRNHHSEVEHSFTGGTKPGSFADVGGISITNILGGYAFPGYSNDMRHQIHPSRAAVENWILSSPDMYAPQFETPSGFLNNTYQFTQTTKGAFAQANFASGGLRGNVGIRVVKNTIQSTAYVLGGDVPKLPPLPTWLQTNTRHFTDVLPSFNIVYDDGSGIVYRFGAAKVIAWAPYRDYLGQKFLQNTLLTGTGGNPELDPYEAYSFSGSIAWYFQPQSVLAITPFYYHILDYIGTRTVPDREFNSLFDSNPALYESEKTFGDCDDKGFCTYQSNIPESLGAARIKGMSVSYQQPFGDSGFHILANYTFAEGSLESGGALPQNAKNSYSISPFYENRRFLARVTYGWTSRVASGSEMDGAPKFVHAYAELDSFLSWSFNRRFSVSLSALNLLNERYRVSAIGIGNAQSAPTTVYTNGRRFMLTLHYRH